MSNWPAARRWQGHAGLDYLSQLAGEAQVQAMLNDKQDALFFGDIRQFTPSNCSFAAFLSSARQCCKPSDTPCANTQQHSPQNQAYLAQASLDNAQPLHMLQQDISVPKAIRHTDISHTNLWMNFRCLLSPCLFITFVQHRLLGFMLSQAMLNSCVPSSKNIAVTTVT